MFDLYVDDIRPTPNGWVRAYSTNQAIDLLKTGRVRNLSLDHDAGDYATDGGDFIKVVLFMCEYSIWPTGQISIHSMNPVGIRNMQSLIDRYRPV